MSVEGAQVQVRRSRTMRMGLQITDENAAGRQLSEQAAFASDAASTCTLAPIAGGIHGLGPSTHENHSTLALESSAWNWKRTSVGAPRSLVCCTVAVMAVSCTAGSGLGKPPSLTKMVSNGAKP